MKVDVKNSEYHEATDADKDFSRTELRRARLLLRRLRYLSDRARENEAKGDTSAPAMFIVWEVEALEWALGPDGIDFLATDNRQRRNTP